MTEHEVQVTRVFDAPRDLVFKAWTDPDHVAKWWGPEHFHTPRESVDIDPRVGGRFHLTMVDGGSGSEYPMRSEIIELVEPELIVLRAEPIPESGIPEATITRVEFHDHDGKTRIELTGGPYMAEMRGNAEAGWISQFEKLDGLLSG